MLRYGTYIFGGDYSLYVVVDDGVSLVPQPDRPECQMRVSRHRGVCFTSFHVVIDDGLCSDHRGKSHICVSRHSG